VVEGTVKVYVSGIFRQLGVRNRVEAAILAHEAGLIPRGTRPAALGSPGRLAGT
jgi:hypothetical protein